MITVRIPAPRGLGTNLLGVVGLLAVVVAVGGLTGNWWWSLLLGGLAAVGLAYVAALNGQVDNEQEQAGGPVALQWGDAG